MAERQRTGIAISGVDIASPDHSVTDGKCQELHNMRYTNGAWRNVHPFVEKHNLNSTGYEIIYHHPGTRDNEYIAKKLRLLYAYYNFVNMHFYYFTNEVIKVGDAVYNDEKELIGYITSEPSQQTVEVVVQPLSGEPFEINLDRDSSMDMTGIVSHISWVRVKSNGDISLLQDICSIDRDTEVAVSHFGKVLILSNHQTQEMMYFAFNGANYSKKIGDAKAYLQLTFASSRISPEVEFKLAKGFEELNAFGLDAPVTSAIVAYEKVCNPEKTEWYFQDFNEENDDWRGEFAIFAALRMEDGSILYRTAPQIINSAQPSLTRQFEPDAELIKQQPLLDNGYYASVAWDNSIWDETIGGDFVISESDYDRYSAEYHKFRTIECSIDFDADPLVHDVAIYATRLYSFLDRDKNGNFYNSVDLLAEPFYLMDVVKSKTIYKIGYANLKNIEQRPLFVPTIPHSAIYADKLLDYNNSLHLLSPSTKRPYFFADNVKTIDEEYGGAEFIAAKWIKDGIEYYSDYYPEEQNNVFSLIQDKLIVLSNNVQTLYFANESTNNKYPIRGSVLMSYSSTLDMSYCVGLRSKSSTTFLKYKAINVYNPDYDKNGTTITIELFTKSVSEPNRIQVSEANNCFVYPYENSYRVGSETSTIIAANSAAVEMSDAKFGEFPLYVFTDEGVFAMQSGGNDALYSAIIPISYDKAINPNTLAVNYNVLFVTKEGIMALSSQGVRQLSQELDNLNGNLPEWMKTTQLLHLPRFNEIVATDFADKKLYVYSAAQQVWSSRDVEPGRLLNNGEIVADNNTIYNLLSEDDNTTNTEVTILTRPIKLGSMELKRLETFILRFEASTAQTIEIQLYGSTDTVNWIKFREVSVYTNRDIIIRRVPLSAKYLRVEITGAVTDDIRIIAMEMEYYLRMLHRMR